MDSLEQKIYAEQVRLTYEPIKLSLISTFSAAVFLIAVQWGVISQSVLLSWLLAMVLLLVAHGFLAYRYCCARPNVADTKIWGHYYVISTTLSGLMWGAGSILFFPESNFGNQITVAFAMVMVSVGGVITIAHIRGNAYALAIPAMLPLVPLFMMEETHITTIFAVMSLAGLAFVLLSASYMYTSSYENIRLRIAAVEHEESLIAAQKTVEKANRAKSEFLSKMSHELRTPLNSILGFGQLLQYDKKEPLTESQIESVGHIMNGGNFLLELIDDILDLAKIEAGKTNLYIENINTKTVLDECLSLIRTMAEDRGIKIVIGEGFNAEFEIRADYSSFKRALLNILSNAIKYNRDKGKVTLDCRATVHGMLHISITDTGLGIQETMFDRLFTPFDRLLAEHSKIEGTGIGLSITKQLIERMDGKIGVNSKIGKGTTFWIELPIEEEKLSNQAPIELESAKNITNLLPTISGTVLYVEDNPTNMLLMKTVIKHIEGLSFIPAETGELGIKLANTDAPDLIILDINLPTIDGFEVLKELQSSQKTRDIPVIALSANVMKEDVEKGIKAGFTHYLSKPIKMNEIAKTIHDILKK